MADYLDKDKMKKFKFGKKDREDKRKELRGEESAYTSPEEREKQKKKEKSRWGNIFGSFKK